MKTESDIAHAIDTLNMAADLTQEPSLKKCLFGVVTALEWVRDSEAGRPFTVMVADLTAQFDQIQAALRDAV